MRTSVVPELIDAMVARFADELGPAGIRVSDGVGVTDDPADYLMVGVDDPFASENVSSVESEQTWATVGAGAARTETGSIMCAAMSWAGDTNMRAVRDRVYSTLGSVSMLVRPPADISLGVAGVYDLSFGTRTRFESGQDTDGCFALVMFQIYFAAQI